GVWIAGGPGLAIAEVNCIMAEIHRKSDGAPLLMGAGIAREMGDTLLVCLLAAKPEEALESDLEEVGIPRLSAGARPEGFSAQLLDHAPTPRQSRFVPPPPSLPPEKLAQFLKQQARNPSRARKTAA